ncbi:DUF2284 domain-containing protein [Thermodesulfobacteriota bacterium]
MDTRERKLIEASWTKRRCDRHAHSLVDDRAFEEIKRLTEEMGFRESRLLKTEDIVTANWVGLKCRYGCAKYNTSWCCPPAAPDLEQVRALLDEYEVALLLMRDNNNDSFYRNNTEKRRCQIKQWKATVSLERRLFLMGYYKAFGIPADTCALCKECAFPEGCKFPNEKRPSVEACSIDIFKTVRRLGESIELAGEIKQSYNSYSLILIF